MEMQFHRTLLIDGVTYKVGHQDLSEKVMSHPHVKFYLECGEITPVGALQKEANVFSMQERNEALAKNVLDNPSAKLIDRSKSVSKQETPKKKA